MTEVHKKSFPGISRQDNEKDLPYDLAEVIISLAHRHLPNIPVYFKSSCAITHMLEAPSISSVQVLSRQECEMSLCPLEQRQVCAGGKIYSMNMADAQKIIDRLGIPARVIGWDASGAKLATDPPLDTFTYALRQVVLNHIGRGS